MPLVSVLLPVHNASATLGAALDSLLAQSLPDFEVVAQDDGTLALLQAYAQRDARVRPLPQVLLHWRDDPARATRTDTRYAVENFLRAKAHYLLAGPLHDHERVIFWVAGQMGRCLAKHLQRAGAQVAAFLEVNPQKYRTQLRGAPVLPATILPELHAANPQQLILVAVAAAGPRAIIRSRLAGWNLRETIEFWCVA